MLIAECLGKRFGTLVAVDDISLTIPPGTIYGFVGPNGAGKTTTIRMLTLGSRPSSGVIRFRDREVTADPLWYKRHFGYAPAEPFLHDLMTGREFLNFVADLREMPLDGRGAIDRLLETFEITADADRLIAGYSTGMKRKIGLMTALLHEPDLLFLDEPTNGLDAVSVHRLKDLLHERRSRGATIFLTTHILEVVEKLADRIGIIHRGRSVAEGTLEDLRALGRGGNRHLEDIFLDLTDNRPPDHDSAGPPA